jgi:hypothetical protein
MRLCVGKRFLCVRDGRQLIRCKLRKLFAEIALFPVGTHATCVLFFQLSFSFIKMALLRHCIRL